MIIFTLLADGTKDKSGFENISVSLHYIKNGKPFESLLKMLKADRLDAQSFCTLLLNTLRDSDLDLSQILCQCNDGATVMSGNQGVQKILQDSLNKQIPYVHCYNHKLHLVVIDLLKEVPELKQFFDELCLLYTFFSKFKVDSVYQGARLKQVLDTCWLGHYHATCTVVENFNEIVEALSSIVSGPDSANFDADTYAMVIGPLYR